MSDIIFQPLGDPLAAGERLENIADIDPRMTRTHYFDGRLLTAEDLERDQIYLDQRLREVGKVLGHGILRGLNANYDRFTGLLTVDAGQAVTPAGRVLHLGSSLIVDMGDRALISQLNSGKNGKEYRRFNRALFAVVLRYVEVATDVAEVFPTDLSSKRGADYALVTESVQLGLVQLPTALAQQDPLNIRSGLIREYLGNSDAGAYIPEDSIALGVLAIQNDTPQWFDNELLRQPLRSELSPGDIQKELSRQYEALMSDVLAARSAGSLNNNFAARDYFDLLPPVGSLPKDAIDPVNGYQRYFPEHFDIHIAPIREAELALIKAESMSLPNIDLTRMDDADIVVLVPLSNQAYGHYAKQLERDYNSTTRKLPQLDLLRLKLYPTHPVHQIDTDATTWQAIWDQLDIDSLIYVRRPVRAAETSVSGIVLALGTTPPPPPPPTDGGGNDNGGSTGDGGIIEDEDTVFLRFLNFKLLAKTRVPESNESQEAIERLADSFARDARVVRLINNILLRIERHYDPLIWQTLYAAANSEALEEFNEKLMDVKPGLAETGRFILQMDSLKLPDRLLEQWESMIKELER